MLRVATLVAAIASVLVACGVDTPSRLSSPAMAPISAATPADAAAEISMTVVARARAGAAAAAAMETATPGTPTPDGAEPGAGDEPPLPATAAPAGAPAPGPPLGWTDRYSLQLVEQWSIARRVDDEVREESSPEALRWTWMIEVDETLPLTQLSLSGQAEPGDRVEAELIWAPSWIYEREAGGPWERRAPGTMVDEVPPVLALADARVGQTWFAQLGMEPPEPVASGEAMVRTAVVPPELHAGLARLPLLGLAHADEFDIVVLQTAEDASGGLRAVAVRGSRTETSGRSVTTTSYEIVLTVLDRAASAAIAEPAG